MVVGVMGYQGGSDPHIKALTALGISCKKIYKPQDLEDMNGLILPGGESSVQYQYCIAFDIYHSIRKFIASGKPVFGTCAGAILLSHIDTDKVKGLGLLDIEVKRNAYGRQIASGVKTSDNGNQVAFIRAPVITSIGNGVEILDSYQHRPILVKQGNIYGATYHPELLDVNQENLLYRLFSCS